MSTHITKALVLHALQQQILERVRHINTIRQTQHKHTTHALDAMSAPARSVFQLLDYNRSGELTLHELIAVLGGGVYLCHHLCTTLSLFQKHTAFRVRPARRPPLICDLQTLASSASS